MSCCILFNHESPRRGENFVTRKISLAVANIVSGNQKKLVLGNLSAQRDWGYAPEYVEAMWRMLQTKNPGDFVIATGKTFSVMDFVREAFLAAGVTDWEKYVDYDRQLERPNEVHALKGRATLAKKILGWQPEVRFKQLVRIMVDADRKLVENLVPISKKR